jgi:diguanylate cyclase (GGDEF)-like protein
MRIGIAPKLALVLAIFAVLASGLTGYYAHDSSYRLLMARTEKNLQSSSHILGQQLVAAFGAVADDARMYASQLNPPTGVGEEMQRLSYSMLQIHSEYLQINVIDTRQGWQEKLSLVNDKGNIVRVASSPVSLMSLAARSMHLSPGQVYFSDVIDIEGESRSAANHSSVLVVTPVPLENGMNSGMLVVIRVDLNSLFTKIQMGLPLGYQFYFADKNGVFVHDHDAMDKAIHLNDGKNLIQTLFPMTGKIVSGERDSVVTSIQGRQAEDSEIVAAFYRVQIADFSNETFFILGLSEPLRNARQESSMLAGNVWRIVFSFSCLALLVAWGVSQAVTQPLAQILASVRRFAAGEHSENLPLPVWRQDEVGLLARGVEEMQKQIRVQVTALEENHQAMIHMAHHDALTGLPNRLTFLSLLENAIAQAKRQGRKLAVLFVDLDRFKAINDQYGHQVGDELLQMVALRLRNGVRASDTAARLSGDEFVVLLNPIHNSEEACLVANKLLQRFNQPAELEEVTLSIQASIGVSLFPDHGESPQTLLEAADVAMYASKGSGRNICSLAKTPSSDADA